MFEIISSQHLELSSMEAERERERQRAKELEKDGWFISTVVLKELCHDILSCFLGRLKPLNNSFPW